MSGIIRASSTNDGEPERPSNIVTCEAINYQTVTSHGNAAVSDGTVKTTILYNPGFSLLTPVAYYTNKKGVVHIPVAAPVALAIDPASLQDIVVKFTSTNSATIENLYLYYDNNLVASANPNKSSTFLVSFTKRESTVAAYSAGYPQGICLTLNINFPELTSSIKLESVKISYLYDQGNKIPC